MRIGQVARIVGISTRAIRHYHHLGVLAEPPRAGNGYRMYSLDDVTALLRIRRLVELGMSLDEVADVIGDSRNRELSDILAELDSDLAAQEAAISERRRRIAALAEAADSSDIADTAVSPEIDDIAAQITEIYAGAPVGARIEVSTMEILTSAIPGAADIYRNALADPEVAAAGAGIATRFEALSRLEPGDGEVAELAADIVAVAHLLPPVDEGSLPTPEFDADDLMDALDTDGDMTPAQNRCLRLVIAAMRPQDRR